MRQKVATIVFMLLAFFAISQSIYLTAQMDAGSFHEPTLRATTTVSEINAAHITKPATLPVVQEYKTDLPAHAKTEIVYALIPCVYSCRALPHVTESHGFLDVRKYQSNYLP